MERRLYFIVGDILTCLFAGAAGGWLAHAAVPGDVLSLFGMFIGMFLGMTAGMLAGFAFAPFFGAMEVMLPASLAGMVAGMVIGMKHLMLTSGPSEAMVIGAMIGAGCLVFTYILQARLHGDTP